MARMHPLQNGKIYHITNKSIAGYKIFPNADDYQRMRYLLQYFIVQALLPKFSNFLKLHSVQQQGFLKYFAEITAQAPRHVRIIAYCLMPTHLHLAVQQEKENGISTYISNALNSYTRYFNTKYKRKGPLWVGRFKNILVETDEQLLHLTRYIHLNPVTARLVDRAIDWPHSSFSEYIPRDTPLLAHERLCTYQDLITMSPDEYASFVAEQISLQRELAEIKQIALE